METPYRFLDIETDTYVPMTDREIRAYNNMVTTQTLESLAQAVIRHHRQHPEAYNWEE